MPISDIFLLAASLSMDSFAVALLFGVRDGHLERRQIVSLGVLFGLVQGSFILAACILGSTFKDVIAGYDHWIAFVLLAVVALHMLKEGKEKIDAAAEAKANKEASAGAKSEGQPESRVCGQVDDQPGAGQQVNICPPAPNSQNNLFPCAFLTLLSLAVATSIDSLGAGIGISLIEGNNWLLPLTVGVATAVFCLAGCLLGRKVASVDRVGGFACVGGGLALLSIGLDILYKHNVF